MLPPVGLSSTRRLPAGLGFRVCTQTLSPEPPSLKPCLQAFDMLDVDSDGQVTLHDIRDAVLTIYRVRLTCCTMRRAYLLLGSSPGGGTCSP